jgi:GNAT superfamily N-acetyltransferase
VQQALLGTGLTWCSLRRVRLDSIDQPRPLTVLANRQVQLRMGPADFFPLGLTTIHGADSLRQKSWTVGGRVVVPRPTSPPISPICMTSHPMTDPLKCTHPGLRLRFAAVEDADLILEFILALADYEKLAHEVVADADSLSRSLFGEHPAAEILIAEFHGQPAGFALFFRSFSTFLGKPGLYLEDLFVKAEHRGQGIGRELLGCLARIARQRECGRLEWSVLDWNESAIHFYRGLGARPLDGWSVFRVTGDSLEALSESVASPGA